LSLVTTVFFNDFRRYVSEACSFAAVDRACCFETFLCYQCTARVIDYIVIDTIAKWVL